MQDIRFSTPEIDVINNVHVVAESDPEQIKAALVAQLHSPVRWTETVEHILSQGVETLYEVGPGKVLTGLAKRIVKGTAASAINDEASLQAALQEQ